MSSYIAKCVAYTKKVSSRKPLQLTLINWLRELDLNQRPSGYEERNALFSIVFTCNYNLSELIRILCLQIFQPNQPCQKFLSITTNYQNFCNFFVTGCRLKYLLFIITSPPMRVNIKKILFSRARKTSGKILRIKSYYSKN